MCENMSQEGLVQACKIRFWQLPHRALESAKLMFLGAMATMAIANMHPFMFACKYGIV